jgi:hypothetical protein
VYSIFVYTDPTGVEFDCYQCAETDCESKPFLTLNPPESRYVCGDCAHVTPATFVSDDELSGHWQPDEAPVADKAAA